MAFSHKNLMELRQKAALTQDQLSRMIGLSTSFISRMERGERPESLTIGRVEAWASACGARLELVKEGEELAGLRDDEKAVVEAWRAIRERGQVDRLELAVHLLRCLPRLDDVLFEMIRAQVEVACKSAGSKEPVADEGREKTG